MKRQYILPIEGHNPVDDFMEEMYESIVYVPSSVYQEDLYEETKKYLGDYLSKDHNDVCFADEVGYIPYIESSEKNVIQLMEFEKIKHDLNIDVDLYSIATKTTEEKTKKYSDNRIKIIRSMYDYQGKVAKTGVVQNTGERIHSWYVHGFDTVEKIENVFVLEDIYDMDIDFKVYVEDQCEYQYMDGRKHIKILQYFKAFIDQNGEQYLKDEEYCIGVIISALIDLDITQNRELNNDYIIYKVQESIYSTIAMDFYKKHYEDMVPFLVKNYKKAKTDIELNLSRSERQDALLETGKIVQSLLQVDVKDYIPLKIFWGRINGSHQGLTALLTAVENSDVNYIMSTDDKTFFYPYISDMLLDIYRYQYMAKSDTKNIDSLKPAVRLQKKTEYKDKIFSDQYLYHKTLLLNSINRNQINSYLLNQYCKVLEVDFNKLSILYRQLVLRPNQEVPEYYKKPMDIHKIPLSTSFRFYSTFLK